MIIQSRKQEVQWLITSKNTPDALKRAMDFVKDFSQNNQHILKVIELNQTFNQLQKNNPSNASAVDELLFKLLQLLDTVETEFNAQENAAKNHENIVVLRGVCKRFDSNGFELQAINAEFGLGEITGIVGPNANGKSTLMRLVVGDLALDKGAISYPYFEKVHQHLSWDILKHLIAYVPQELPKWQGTLKDNLRYEAALHHIVGAQNEVEVNFIIERLGLRRYENAKWSELSGGYKLRFALAKALIWKPVILVLDEPLANLDINAQTLVLNDLKALCHSYKNPISLLISSQHIHEIESVSDNMIVLEDGKVRYMGKRADFGLDTDDNIFEFATACDPNDLTNLLNELPNAILRSHGFYYSLKTPKSVTMQQVLLLFIQKNISLEYFRDITFSVKQMFL
jgi:ABC-2 type transport system ATP-binding protein